MTAYSEPLGNVHWVMIPFRVFIDHVHLHNTVIDVTTRECVGINNGAPPLLRILFTGCILLLMN